MGKNDYFGERALMFDEPRSANIIVNTTGMLLYRLDMQKSNSSDSSAIGDF